MGHHSKKGFQGIFVGITQHQTGYLIYVLSKRKMVSSHDVLLDETFYSVLQYTSYVYSEALMTLTELSYITYTTLSHGQTDDIITFENFEDGNLVENEWNSEEDEPISALINDFYTYDNSEEGYISTNALEDIRYVTYIHPEINSRDDILKIRDGIRQEKSEWKWA